ncbi:hypothetical protein IRZ71_03185 [Flavobacterium sp. ANB]|uniref:GldM family protein n=1 Tax=unclassified Flavobacterium TaxID=196869 RepID=UPI0012B8C7F2|nr:MULTISPECIES: GldM family protein [unclassified Flavobacterium]MBF4515325.1 hypothetical protein [Flavobacterium sp. ANB]MTD70237.1 hypothetical protein [Flavobacterium sp. LC2016-13]
MKIQLLVFLFCFSLSITAQKDSTIVSKSNIAVVSADKLNVVYRGILNPISISVPNCRSFIATSSGLNKISEGKYSLSPGQGLFSIIKLDIELNNGSKITEEHKFRINGINHIFAKINDRSNCEKCILEMTKEELYNSNIQYSYPDDFLFDLNLSRYKINNFLIKFSNNKKIVIAGNSFNNNVNSKIKKLKKGAIFVIDDIGYSFPGSENYLLPRLIPIKIMIVEKEIQENYYESKEFIRDSIRRIKNEKKLLKNN